MKTRAAVAVVLLVASTGAYLLGVPWLLPAAVVILLILAAVSRMSWGTAFAAGTIVPLAALAATMAVLPALGIPLVAGLAATMLVIGMAAIGLICAAPIQRPVDRSTALFGASVLVVPGLVALSAAVAAVTVRPGWSWAMWNDGMGHLLDTRFFLANGGQTTGGPRDPLAPELFAIFAAPGRHLSDPGELLSFDVGRQAVTALIVLCWMSIAFSILIGRVVPRSQPYVRCAVAVAVGLLPWTWFISGFALRFGYLNALVAMIVLLAGALIWLDRRDSPPVATALLMLTAVALLAVWAVFAVVAIGWGVTLLLQTLRQHLALRGAHAAAWAGAFVFSAAYAFLVTLPSMRQSGEIGLTANAMFFQFEPFQPALILVVLILLAVVTARTHPGQRGGVTVLIVSVLFGLGLLLAQRTGTGVELWGYYPQKYAWTLSVLAVAMIARMIAIGISVDLTRKRDRYAAPVVVLLAAFAVMAAAPPHASPLVPKNVLDLGALFPMMSIVDGNRGTLTTDLDYLENFAPSLYSAEDHRGRILFSRYFDDRVGDEWVNQSLVSLASRDGSPLSRRSFHTLDLTKPHDLCEALSVLGPGVIVWTRSRTAAVDIAASCGNSGARVDVEP